MRPSPNNTRTRRHIRSKERFAEIRAQQAATEAAKRVCFTPWTGKEEPDFQVEMPWNGKE